MNRPTPTEAPDDEHRAGLLASLLLGAVRAYRLVLSPLLGPRCRYLPSCSEYTCEAIVEHGAWRGSYLGVRRVLRCHPWGGSGHDPVPPAR